MRILSNLSRGLLNRKRHLLRSHWLSTAREGQVLLVYKEMVSSGALEFNEDQYKVLLRLSRLSNYLEGASPREFQKISKWAPRDFPALSRQGHIHMGEP